ncbi:PAS domain-containing hybrid sensor histidine kinase/response regulator [Horticoccus sp. 23ND18S-11]|uniref:PAS domain-containing hybrid sensor histidine kinase/response regulator n=1 Tax=Horticoccus sp. 23ND18S-11 TaxID=3391832 RepID=UPI0039C8C856
MHGAAGVGGSVWPLALALLAGLVAAGAAFTLGRRWRQQALEREEQLNHSILSHGAHSVITTDPRGRIETFSSGAERLLGFQAAEVVGRMSCEAFHDPTEMAARAVELAQELKRPVAPGFDALVAKAEVNSHAEEHDWIYLRRDGARVPVRVSVTPMRDRRGRTTGYLVIASDVTRQRHAEERRRELAARFSKIAAQVPGMVFQLKQFPDGRRCFPFASEGIRQIYRVEPEAVAEDSAVIWDLIHPEDFDRVADSIHQSAQALARWECEYRTRFADGTVRWLSGTAMPERQEDGSILWQGFITDVTDRKVAERTHEESRVLLQSVFSSVDLGVFVVDVTNGGDFRFLEVNPAYERLTGLNAVDIRGRTPRELVPLVPAEMAECLRASFRRGAESSGPIEYEEPFFVRGQLVWWLTRLTPLRDSVGNVVRLVGRSLDITERKTIELRFQSLTERLQLATEAAQVGIWDHDLIQKRTVWDNRMHALYGLAPSAFDGTDETWLKCIHADDLSRVERETSEAVDGDKPFNTSYRIIRPDGEEREIRACAHVQRNPAGRAIRMVGVNWDVTAERRAQAEIVRARDEAERLNGQLENALGRANQLAQEAAAATVAKSEFLANMSHEIRTPLNAVIGMSGLLLGTDLSKEQREFSETIRTSGDGLLGLLNDILDYSKIESGRLDLEHRPFDLRECLESSLDVLAGRAAEKNIDLLCAIDPGVPESIVGDDTRLRQVLVNLLSNAVKFTASGQVFLSVAAVGRDAKGARLRFSVHDSGIGIPSDRMDRLFKTFSQVDASTTRQFGGTGLGLAICKRLVELMGGRIWAESAIGNGSVFHFEVTADPLALEKPFVTAVSPVLASRRVLIVDDNATSCRVLAQQAEAWGMTSRAVSSGVEALALLEQESTFDLAFVDAEMPGMSGPELVAVIRRTRSAMQLPVIMLTRRGRLRVADELAIAGFASKPVKTSVLYDLCVEVLHGRKVRAPSVIPDNVVMGEEHPLAILLAEDNPVNQRVATLMLQRLGYRADIAANGREALEAVERQRYDLILMDVQMPEMDGLQAAREIRARFPAGRRPRIVAMTANASTADRDECFAAGMDDFLTKPVRNADLRKAIQATPVRMVATAA